MLKVFLITLTGIFLLVIISGIFQRMRRSPDSEFTNDFQPEDYRLLNLSVEDMRTWKRKDLTELYIYAWNRSKMSLTASQAAQWHSLCDRIQNVLDE